MIWTLRVAKRAQKGLAKAPAKSQRLLRAALEEMQLNPFNGDLVRLQSERASWRRRVGSYRIFFDVYPDSQLVDILDIARRTSITY
jgi:mRNA-degrading endonuclease RelE of RelBE toxin-antitoxin system